MSDQLPMFGPATSEDTASATSSPESASGPTSSASGYTSWPTPKASDGEKGGPNQRGSKGDYPLPSQANLASWATPAARDYISESASAEFNAKRDSHPRGKPLSYEVLLAASGPTPNGFPAEFLKYTEQLNGGQLNPEHSRWLMGLPPVFYRCVVSAMQSLRLSRKPSSKVISKRKGIRHEQS